MMCCLLLLYLFKPHKNISRLILLFPCITCEKIDLRWNSLSGATHVVSIWIQVFLAPCSMLTAAWRLADIEHIGNLHLWVSGKGLRAWYWRPLCIMGVMWLGKNLVQISAVGLTSHCVKRAVYSACLKSGLPLVGTVLITDQMSAGTIPASHQDLFNSDTWSRLTIRTDLTVNKKFLICAKHCEKSVKNLLLRESLWDWCCYYQHLMDVETRCS